MPVQTSEILFAEDQSFRQKWIWALMLGMLMLLLTIFGLILRDGLEKEGARQALAGMGVGIIVTVAVAALLWTLRLSVRLDNDCLRVRFFPMLKREIPLDQIEEWHARTYRPIVEYGGWGIRFSWKGMAYNVSGNRGVQLKLTNGKRVLIGSQHADDLAAAISRAKGRG